MPRLAVVTSFFMGTDASTTADSFALDLLPGPAALQSLRADNPGTFVLHWGWPTCVASAESPNLFCHQCMSLLCIGTSQLVGCGPRWASGR